MTSEIPAHGWFCLALLVGILGALGYVMPAAIREAVRAARDTFQENDHDE